MGDMFGVGAAVQGAAQAAAAGLNYEAQKDYNEKYLQGVQETNKTNIDLAHEQNDWNLKQWYREIAYNDPAEQVVRLRNAGLSAAAAAQAIEGAGNAGPLQSADLSVAGAPGPLQAPQLDVSGLNLIGIARSLEDLKQSKLQTKSMQNNLEFEPSKLFTEQQLREWNLRRMEQDFQFNAEANPYRLRGYKYDIMSKKQEIKRSKLEQKIMKQNLKEARQRFGFLEKFNDAQLKEIFGKIALVAQQRANAQKEGKLLDQDFERKELLRTFDKYGGVPEDFVSRMAILIGNGIIKPEDIDRNFDTFRQVIGYLIKGKYSYMSDDAIDVLSNLLSPVSSSLPKLPKPKDKSNIPEGSSTVER